MPIEDFAHIRVIRGRQVLFTKGWSTDKGGKILTINVSCLLGDGEALMEEQYTFDPKAMADNHKRLWADIIAGGHDAAMDKYIVKKENELFGRRLKKLKKEVDEIMTRRYR